MNIKTIKKKSWGIVKSENTYSLLLSFNQNKDKNKNAIESLTLTC